MDVYLNGKMVEYERASIRIDDAGFQHAVGLFETMGVCHGRAFRLTEHIERLRSSSGALGLSRDLDLEALRAGVEKTIEHNGLERARVRLTVTPGSVPMVRPVDGDQDIAMTPTVLVVATEPTVYDPDYFEKGVMVLIAPAGANPFDGHAGHKTLNYWSRLRTLRQAAAAGAGEAIWLNVTNHLASGAVSNLFLVKDEALYTPFAKGEEVQGALPAPVLPGVTRAVVLELAESIGVPVHKQMLSVEDLLGADEVFLTNSGWNVLPVSSVEKHRVGDGVIGKMTRRLREALLGVIERETSGVVR